MSSVKRTAWIVVLAAVFGLLLGVAATIARKGADADSTQIALPRGSDPGDRRVKTPQVSSDTLAESPAAVRAVEPKDLWRVKDPERLLAVFKKGVADPSDPVASFLGFVVFHNCQPWIMNMNFPDRDVSGDTWRAMHEARAEMKRRCGGMVQIPRSEYQRLMDLLVDGFQMKGAPTSSLLKSLPRNPSPEAVSRFRENLRANIAEGDLNSLLWTNTAIADWLERLSSDTAAGNRASRDFVGLEDPIAVSILAVCELGFDCSDSSFIYLSHCAVAAACGGSFQATITEGMSEQRIRNAEDAARKLAAVIRARDTQALGLD